MGRVIDVVRSRCGARILGSSEALGEETVTVGRDDLVGVMETLRDDRELEFDVLVDLTAVDYPGRSPRFDLVIHLLSIPRFHRLRVRVGVEGDDPRVPTLSGLWKNADWLERECFDLFGIRFDGHPDLRRILMYPEFEGHPLRKDYPVMKRQPIIPERDPVSNPWPPRRVGVKP